MSQALPDYWKIKHKFLEWCYFIISNDNCILLNCVECWYFATYSAMYRNVCVANVSFLWQFDICLDVQRRVEIFLSLSLIFVWPQRDKNCVLYRCPMFDCVLNRCNIFHHSATYLHIGTMYSYYDMFVYSYNIH